MTTKQQLRKGLGILFIDGPTDLATWAHEMARTMTEVQAADVVAEARSLGLIRFEVPALGNTVWLFITDQGSSLLTDDTLYSTSPGGIPGEVTPEVHAYLNSIG